MTGNKIKGTTWFLLCDENHIIDPNDRLGIEMNMFDDD